MALLTFPATPNNGDVYPVSPPAGTNVYMWSSADQTWLLLGKANGIGAGTYGTPLDVPQFTVDVTGRITFAQNVAIQLGDTTQVGLVQLVDDTTSNDPSKALTAAQGFYLQTQIGNISLLSPPFPNLVAAINASKGPSGVTAGTYGTSLSVGRFTVDIYGRITNAVDVPIATATSISPGLVTVGSNIQVAAGVISVPLATTAQAGVVTVGSNIQVAGGVISVQSASTTQAGVVQLNDTVTSTSTTEAATANALKTAYDLAAAAVPCSSFAAKGNILGGTGAGTFTALPVGSDHQSLLADSTTATGLKWSTLGFQNLDDISGSFNGVLTSFPLTLGGVAYSPNPVSNIMVFLGGVPQIPGAGNAYTIAGSTLTFSAAPLANTSFYATTVY